MGEARPVQAWLSSEDPEKWASAMVACQSHAPWECGEHGECLQAGRGGSCFTTERQAASTAWQMIARLDSDNEAVKAQLDRAVAFLRYGKTD